MNISEKVIDIVKGMEGIGGVPTDEEFLNEFEFRLEALKQGQTLPLDSDFCECEGVQDLHAMTGECRKCGKECAY